MAFAGQPPGVGGHLITARYRPGEKDSRAPAGPAYIRGMRWIRAIALAAVAIVAASCSGSTGPAAAPATDAAPPPASWAKFRHIPGVVDLAARSDGSFLVAAGGRLLLLGPRGLLTPFARGAAGYQTATGTEPYIATVTGVPVAGQQCSFTTDTAFAIQPGALPEVIMISPQGTSRTFATLPPGRSLTGIAFDGTGRFGHRLLVAARWRGRTTVFGIGCDGQWSVAADNGPLVEGGMVVAPAAFGKYGGDLIAPDEGTGRVYAVTPSGAFVTLAQSHLPAGGDVGVESAGFVPAGATTAYLADRFAAGNKHPGDDSILSLPAAQLARAGIRAGDLLVATEGGAKTIDVRCAGTCAVRYVAAGPVIAHSEGHIVFAS